MTLSSARQWCVCLTLAAGLGLLSFQHSKAALAIAVLPAVPLFLLRAEGAAVLGFSLLPFSASLPTGTFEISPSDVCLTIATLGFLARPHGLPKLARAIKPLALPLFLYFAALLLVAAKHPEKGAAQDILQRVALVIFPLLIAASASEKTLRNAVRGFASVGVVFAVVWPLFLQTSRYGVQKNPAGQFMIDALIVLLARPGLVKFQPYAAALLFVGALVTQSRGAVLGLLVAMVVLVIFAYGNRRRTVGVAIVFSVLFLGVFQLATPAQRQRAFHTSATDDFAILYRQEFATAAKQQRASAPLLGVGLSNYTGPSLSDPTVTAVVQGSNSDPHNVLLLEGAEGGYVLEFAFVALLTGTGIQLLRVRGPRRGTWQLALALHVALFVHGLVDVYWVRNGVTIAWFATGLALVRPNVLAVYDVVTTSPTVNEGLSESVAAAT